MDAGCAGEWFELGTGISADVEEAFRETEAGMPAGDVERLYVGSLLDRVRRGELSLFTVLSGGKVAGVVCYRNIDCEAELAFGFLRREYEGAERPFLERIVSALSGQGVRVVRTGFTWPGAGRFVAAAHSMGFYAVRRISMVRDVDERDMFTFAPAAGVNLLPWSPAYFEGVSRIMYEASEPADRLVYPLFSTPEGARMLMLSIVQDRHGLFMPELSMAAETGGEIVGFLLSSLLADGSVLILDIAVKKERRRTGLGSRMLEHLISKCAVLGKRQLVLAVTADNLPAINLYKKAGFRETTTFDQYILPIKE